MVAFLIPLIIQCVFPFVGKIVCDNSNFFIFIIAGIPFNPFCWMVLSMAYMIVETFNMKIVYGKDEKGNPKKHTFLTIYLIYYFSMLMFYMSVKSVLCKILGYL